MALSFLCGARVTRRIKPRIEIIYLLSPYLRRQVLDNSIPLLRGGKVELILMIDGSVFGWVIERFDIRSGCLQPFFEFSRILFK